MGDHALDVLAVADQLGVARFMVIGQSMGGSVAMKVAELDGARLDAVVLVDVAGRVDRGVAAPISASIDRLTRVYGSVEAYLEFMRSQGFTEPWNEHWDRAYRYGLHEVEGGFRPAANLDAVMEDRAYTATQHPYDRWKHLVMPTLLLRAGRELVEGAGFVVPADDRDRFRRDVPRAVVVEVDANHLTINTNAEAAAAIIEFLSSAPA
jgi:pimeloyl-ACP methyl ester carboxylesterase